MSEVTGITFRQFVSSCYNGVILNPYTVVEMSKKRY